MEKRFFIAVLLGTALVSSIAAVGEEDLFQGCRAGNLGKVMLAVASGADLRAVDAEGNTVLHLAAVSKDVLEYLVGKGAAVDARNRAGCTPLLLAVRGGSWSAAQFLLDKGANLLAVSNRGESALLLAPLTHEKAMVQFIRSKRFPPDHRSPPDGATALHRAARLGDPDAVSLLLESGEDPNATDASSRTALDIAATVKEGLTISGPMHTINGVDAGGQATPILPVHVSAVAESYGGIRYYVTEEGALYRLGPPDYKPAVVASRAGDAAAGPGDGVWFTAPDGTLSAWDGGITASFPVVKAQRIAVGPDGRVWFVTPEGWIGVFTKPGSVQNLPGYALDIAVSRGGAVWKAAADGSVARWDGGRWLAASVDLAASRITVLADGTPYLVTADNRIAWIDGTPEKRAVEASVSSGTGIFHADGEVRRIRSATVAGKSLKIVVVGDGYVREDLETEGEYDKETRRIADAVVDLPPFRYFKDRIDVYAVYVESRQRGADTTPDADDRDTALGASFYSDGLDQRVLLVHDRDALERYARKALPSRDPQSVGLILHEIGHSFAALGDEYGWTGKDDAKPASDALHYPNLDVTGDPARVQWSSLIGRPKMGKVGVFEGGFSRNEGVFRPQEDCLMRFHNQADRYCAVCEEVLYGKLCALLGVPCSREEFLRVYEP